MTLASLIQIISAFAMALSILFDILNPRNLTFSGPIIQSRIKRGKFVEEFRVRVQRETGFEWFQWLAERMLDREQHGSAVPTYIAHKDWKPHKG